jgi:SAM-dependent methyltransferase
VGDFYESHPYPPPADDLENYRRAWNDERRRADSHLFWPHEPYREDRSILVAGCGTSQAAHYAVRWPRARVVGIDVSANSIAHDLELKRRHKLDNLEVRQLAVERAAELGERFDYIVCTGVLHHLAEPDAGLRALREILTPTGVLHVMVYAPYGRAGVYLLQDYCRRLKIGWSEREIDDLAATLKALPPDHPLVPLLRNSADFASAAGLADALLHPQDRAYSVPEFLEFLTIGGLKFGRWVRQAPYLPDCGAIANTPHASQLRKLAAAEQFAALELFRGTLVRHAAIAYRDDAPARREVRFDTDSWREYVPVRLPGTIAVRERLRAGAAAVLINRNHTYTDLYLPVDAPRLRLWEPIDARRTVAEIIGDRENRNVARDFFEQLYRWDQVVFALS